nr:hypothetical protein [Neisseria iguanae]
MITLYNSSKDIPHNSLFYRKSKSEQTDIAGNPKVPPYGFSEEKSAIFWCYQKKAGWLMYTALKRRQKPAAEIDERATP